jgi:hypothetical protein
MRGNWQYELIGLGGPIRCGHDVGMQKAEQG